jgi:hypothetical protein
MGTSGYTDCACPDCFEIAVSDDMDHPDMCNACEEAGCDGESECQAPHAYCDPCREIVVNGKTFCEECGQPF